MSSLNNAILHKERKGKHDKLIIGKKKTEELEKFWPISSSTS
jgi:hypothetical protein